MKKMMLIILLLNSRAFAGMGPDILVPSVESTVLGQILVSGEIDYTFGDKPYVESHDYFVDLAKSSAKGQALQECKPLSHKVKRVSLWTIHKVIRCNDFVCYGVERGKYVATAMFDCL